MTDGEILGREKYHGVTDGREQRVPSSAPGSKVRTTTVGVKTLGFVKGRGTTCGTKGVDGRQRPKPIMFYRLATRQLSTDTKGK